MEEISNFVGNGLASTRPGAPTGDATKGHPVSEGHIHYGLARLYENIAKSVEESNKRGQDVTEVKVLKEFAEQAKQVVPKKE